MLGAPDQVLFDNDGPYPCVVLTDPPGDDRDLQHLVAPILQIEVIGDLDGTVPPATLRRILYTVLARIKELPDQEFAAGEPVVTHVTSAGGGGWVPLPNGQPRYISTVTMFMHPPTSPPA